MNSYQGNNFHWKTVEISERGVSRSEMGVSMPARGVSMPEGVCPGLIEACTCMIGACTDEGGACKYSPHWCFPEHMETSFLGAESTHDYPAVREAGVNDPCLYKKEM